LQKKGLNFKRKKFLSIMMAMLKGEISVIVIAHKVANLRKDTLHKITTYLCKNHAKIVVEDLHVSGMLSNHKLAQVIADCGFHEFIRQLGYKAKKFGSYLLIAHRWFPSSKTCSNCGNIQDMPLKERVYNCRSCSHSMDRDLNAAINLSRLAKA
jgi:putative transposase